MSNKKPWYRSKTIMGILIAIAPNLCGMFGLELSAETAQSFFDNFAAVTGGAMSIYGRFTADSKIG